ncbi:hypothetical protein BBJ28_00009707 [Nothophytophthora sp. Chile5]|nr:hypothetical protein BBJ28_00009707 [Nothophytophthora sp. Chile5]
MRLERLAIALMDKTQDTSALRQELQQLSPAQLRQLLGASGHGDLLRDGAPVDPQLVEAAKVEGNAFFRRGQLHDAVTAYSRATAYVALKQLERAVDDLIAALEFEPRNKECGVKLQAIIDNVLDVQQTVDAAASTSWRRAAVRAAVVLSTRAGWSPSAVRGNPGPAAVNGHTLFLGGDDRVYLFGGRAVREQKPKVFVLDDHDDSSWDVVPTHGTETPSSRAWHSTSAIGSADKALFCVYGGVSSRGEDPQVHLLMPAAPRGFQWLQPRCIQDKSQMPAARSGHTAVSFVDDMGDRAVYIFGGRTKRGVSDQLLVLRCSSKSDSGAFSNVSALQDGSSVTCSWEEIEPRGQDDSVAARSDWPSARDGHSMCLLPGSETRACRLVVFGGNGQRNDDKMNDVWLFDLVEQRWTLLQCMGDVPAPRSYHTAHMVEDFMFVVGGRTADSEDGSVFILDTNTCEWFRVPIPRDRALTARAWHSSVLTSAGKLFVLGGGTFHGPLKDAATLDLSYFQAHAAKLSHVAVHRS